MYIRILFSKNIPVVNFKILQWKKLFTYSNFYINLFHIWQNEIIYDQNFEINR